jgi:hypothetical protein
MIEEKFGYTVKGCAEAKRYLEETNQIEELQKEQSTDGWTLIKLANLLWLRNNKHA